MAFVNHVKSLPTKKHNLVTITTRESAQENSDEHRNRPGFPGYAWIRLDTEPPPKVPQKVGTPGYAWIRLDTP